MANRYAMPVSTGGGSSCGGGGGFWDGGGIGGCSGDCGCTYCDPGQYGPIPAPDNPWAFCPASYSQTSVTAPDPICTE